MTNKGISIEVVNINEVIRNLDLTKRKVAQEVEAGVKKSGFHVQAEVQQSIAGQRAETRSVDTGRFLNSVKTVFPSEYVANISTNVEYADFLEYGTSKFPPRSHFRNTAAREQNNVAKIIKNEIK